KRRRLVTVSISISVAVLLLAATLPMLLLTEKPPEWRGNVDSEGNAQREEEPKKNAALPLKIKVIEPRPGGERVSEVQGKMKDGKVIAPLPEHLKQQQLVILDPSGDVPLPVQPEQPELLSAEFPGGSSVGIAM